LRGSSSTGVDWTDDEIDLIVADYFDMLTMEIEGIPFVKAQRNHDLRTTISRSRGSIERKHQNISAVLQKLGMPWIVGYKPLSNYQAALLDGIDRRLSKSPFQVTAKKLHDEFALQDNTTIFFEQPPMISDDEEYEPEILKRLVRKFDPAESDRRNRALGMQGEELVLIAERSRLKNSGRSDLSEQVRWVSKVDGDGAGYDISSFDERGCKLLLEVKTTTGHRTTPFYLSENERALSVERPEAFRLVRLYDFARSPRAFLVAPPLERHFCIRPTEYRLGFS
jgi:hypothetical protein